MEIKKLNSDIEEHYRQVVDIFFQTSSRKEFQTEKEKNLFKNKYLDRYLDSDFFLMLDEGRILGYLCGDHSYRESDYRNHPYLLEFQEYFHSQSHLHINLLPCTQGLGIGSKLMAYYKKHLKDCGQRYVHIFTAKEARNINFYLKNNFKKIHSSKSILLMESVL